MLAYTVSIRASSAANFRAGMTGPLAVHAGVYNWRGTIGKTVGPDGSRLMPGLSPMDWVAWEGRKVVIAYDADAVTKDMVRIARSELAAHLRGQGLLLAC